MLQNASQRYYFRSLLVAVYVNYISCMTAHKVINEVGWSQVENDLHQKTNIVVRPDPLDILFFYVAVEEHFGHSFCFVWI